ncbi:hypothetical protein V2G26_020401 [Clonostachys chloroleuca]
MCHVLFHPLGKVPTTTRSAPTAQSPSLPHTQRCLSTRLGKVIGFPKDPFPLPSASWCKILFLSSCIHEMPR